MEPNWLHWSYQKSGTRLRAAPVWLKKHYGIVFQQGSILQPQQYSYIVIPLEGQTIVLKNEARVYVHCYGYKTPRVLHAEVLFAS